MQLSKILLPTDYSERAKAALQFASLLARDTGATLLIVHVQELMGTSGEGMLYEGIPKRHDPQGQLPEELKAVQPTEPAVAHEHRLLFGDPATEILRVAEEESANLIVMGTHGRTGLARLLMGSVAEQVLRRASCPVLTVKPQLSLLND